MPRRGASRRLRGVGGSRKTALMQQKIIDEAEELVRQWADALTAPRPSECLPCYLDRVLREGRCDNTLRWSRAYRDAVAPRATALERRLSQRGGYCDCEVLLNVYWSKSDDVIPCRGARSGSTQPCGLWVQHRRGDPW